MHQILISLPGKEVDHGPYFRDIRNKRLEHHGTQVNQILIRLDKLLQNLPSDPLKRKGKFNLTAVLTSRKSPDLCNLFFLQRMNKVWCLGWMRA